MSDVPVISYATPGAGLRPANLQVEDSELPPP